jgi:O-antigen/teichoic acid export membrane protein
MLRIVRNTGWLRGSKALGAKLSLIYHAEQFGAFALILGAAQGVSAIVTFQTWKIILRLGTAPLLREERGVIARLVWFCLIIDLAGGAIGCLMLIFIIGILASHLGWPLPMARHAIWFGFVLLLTVRSTAVGTLRLHDRFKDGALADAATPITRMLGAVVVALAGPSVDGFLWAWALAELTTAITYWFFVWKNIGSRLRGQRLLAIISAAREHDGFWRFAIFTNLSSTLSSASQQFALLAVGYSVGDAAAGFFRLAHQLGQALLTLAEMLNRSLYAEMARVWADRSREAMRSLLVKTDRAALLGGVAVIVSVVILGRPALHLIGGAAYLPAYPLLVLLGIAAAVQLIGVSFEPALIAHGRAGVVLLIRSIAVTCLFLFLALLLPLYHAAGAAIAMLLDALVAVVLFGYTSRRATRGAAGMIDA